MCLNINQRSLRGLFLIRVYRSPIFRFSVGLGRKAILSIYKYMCQALYTALKKRYMNHLCSTVSLLARLDEPQPFIDASCDLREDVSRVGVPQFDRLLACIARMLAKGGERR